MSYLQEWRHISARINGLTQAAELQARFLSIQNATYGSERSMFSQQCSEILTVIEGYQKRFAGLLPMTAEQALTVFLKDRGAFIRTPDSGSPDMEVLRVRGALVLLRGFDAQMNFALADSQVHILSRSERALSHLQRSIVVDNDIRQKWQTAFAKDEPACEALGALHLLSHGIWAFKADARGGTTDLVYPEPVSKFADEFKFAEGLVLTEWKRAKSQADAVSKLEEAKVQARAYSGGVLGGLELVDTRFLVVVTEKAVSLPFEVTDESKRYRCVNIAVNPDSPSVQARRTV